MLHSIIIGAIVIFVIIGICLAFVTIGAGKMNPDEEDEELYEYLWVPIDDLSSDEDDEGRRISESDSNESEDDDDDIYFFEDFL